MTHDEAFLHDIAANPKDDAVRLIYADWLEEHGDPDRAEFIRVQVELGRNRDSDGSLSPGDLARLHSRERRLLSRNKGRWLQSLREAGASSSLYGDFSRGFVEDLNIEAEAFIEHGVGLWRTSPVCRLRITKLGRLARRLARCPHLAHVRHLEFGGKPAPTLAAVRAILESPHLINLHVLSLDGFPLRDADVASLATLPSLPPLRELWLSNATITGATLPALVGRLDLLESLGFSFCKQFDGQNLRAILAALNPVRLRTLSADHTPFGNIGMRAIAEASRFTGLTELWLRGCNFDSEAMEAFSTATHLAKVNKLYLERNSLGDEGVTALAAWPGLSAVRTLDLGYTESGPAGAEALVLSPHLGPLEELRLRANTIGDAGAESIANCSTFASLRELDLTNNSISPVGIRALATSSHMVGLRQLQLEENQVGEEGAAALLESPYLLGLNWLTLGDASLPPEMANQMIVHFSHLRVFSAGQAFLHGENLQAAREGALAGGSEADVAEAVARQLVQAMLDDPDDREARRNYATHLRGVGSPWWVVMGLQDPDGFLPDEVRQRWTGWFEEGRDHWLAPLLPWAQLFSDEESFDRGLLRRVHFHTALPDDVAESLARFPPLALLPLEVQCGHMTGEGAFQVFARCRTLASMTQLDFRSINAAELAHVLSSSHLTALERLSFGPSRLGDDAARLLAASPALSRLRALDLGTPDGTAPDAANCIGPDGLAALASSPNLTGLRFLGLSGCVGIGDAGLRVLLASPVRELSALDIRSTGLTSAGARALAASPWASSLRALRLGGHDDISDDALEALAGSPYLAELRELQATCRTGSNSPGVRALVGRFGPRLVGSGITPASRAR